MTGIRWLAALTGLGLVAVMTVMLTEGDAVALAWLFLVCAVVLLGTGFWLVFIAAPERRAAGCLIMGAGFMEAAGAAALAGYQPVDAVAVVLAAAWAVSAFRDWRNRRGRETARAFGDKSRARVRVLLRRRSAR